MLKIFILAAQLFASGSAPIPEEEESRYSMTPSVSLDNEPEYCSHSELDIDEQLEDCAHLEEVETECEENILSSEPKPTLDFSFQHLVAHESAQVLLHEMNQDEKNEEIAPQFEDFYDLVAISQETLAAADPIEGSAYDTLLITDEEKVKIGKILMTMSENSTFKLLFERKRLEGWGHDINHVHPIRFLGTVFTNPRLIHCMRRIHTSSFKWDGFIDGFSERFKEEIKANNVLAYLPGFAQSVSVDLAPLEQFVHRQDFEGLVLYLMKAKSH